MTTTSSDLLNDCEREPLAFSGLLQSHGALLFLDRASGTFTFGSENLDFFLGESCNDLLGENGFQWVEEMLPQLHELPEDIGRRVYLPRAIDLGEGEINALISPTGNGWLIEFEFALNDESKIEAPRLPTLNNPNDPTEVRAIQQAVVDGLAKITGYDRVMLYQFLPDWSGEVLAESVLRSEGTYLSLRFPATDIPAIARGLYAQAPYRYIPLATNDTVKLLGRGQVGQELDLTWSDLRSVSPVHIQYLTNMNVHASFSISIMVGGKLWGLIASHNDAPGPISLPARLACTELIDEFVHRIEAQRTDQKRRIAKQLSLELSSGLAPGGSTTAMAAAVLSIVATLRDQIYFSNCIVDVAGANVALNALNDQLVAELIDVHQDSDFDSITLLESLPDDLGIKAAAAAENIVGTAAFKLRASRQANALITIILIRPEEAGEVAWAGNPQKPVEVSDGGGMKLSPRQSFEKWVQVRRGLAKTWTEDDVFVLGLLKDLLADALKSSA